jgi:hypothetical protein
MRRNGDEQNHSEAPMTLAEREIALDYLKDPKLTERIVADFRKCGLVSERATVLTAYLAAVSRKLSEPLAVLMYRMPGSINGKTGTFEIGVRPSTSGRTEVIMHRFFRPGP